LFPVVNFLKYIVTEVVLFSVVLVNIFPIRKGVEKMVPIFWATLWLWFVIWVHREVPRKITSLSIYV